MWIGRSSCSYGARTGGRSASVRTVVFAYVPVRSSRQPGADLDVTGQVGLWCGGRRTVSRAWWASARALSGTPAIH
jgi:hypothetical protein